MKDFIYYAIIIAGVAAAVIISLYCGRKSCISGRNIVLFTVTGFLSGMIGAFLISVPYNIFLDAVYNGVSHDTSRFSLFGALLFMPLLIMIPARITGTDYNEIMDICTPGVYAVLTAGKLGCMYYGCCYGVPYENGIVSSVTGQRVFPIQLVEAVFTLLLLASGIVYERKIRHGKGIVYPVMLTVYSVGRFLCEFGRNAYLTESAYTHCLDFWQFVAAFAFVAAVIRIIFLKKSYNKIQKSVFDS